MVEVSAVNSTPYWTKLHKLFSFPTRPERRWGAAIILFQGWRTNGTRAQQVTRKDILGTQHSLLSPFFLFLSPDQHLYIVKNMCLYTDIWLRANYINYRCCILTQIVSGAKCRLDIYHWGAGLAVTGRKRDTVQNVLQFSFQTGSSSSPRYFHIFFLVVFLEEARLEIQ
jgi:hypothetical protein